MSPLEERNRLFKMSPAVSRIYDKLALRRTFFFYPNLPSGVKVVTLVNYNGDPIAIFRSNYFYLANSPAIWAHSLQRRTKRRMIEMERTPRRPSGACDGSRALGRRRGASARGRGGATAPLGGEGGNKEGRVGDKRGEGRDS